MESKPTYWKDLTKEDKDFIFSIYHLDASHDERIEIISKKYGGVSGRTIRDWWSRIGVKITSNNISSSLMKAKENKIHKDTEILLVTSAQNNTLINKRLLQNMKVCCDIIKEKYGKKAQIVVSPVRYRNPTSLEESHHNDDSEWWDSNIEEYLFYDNIYFGDVIISALSRVQPTAKRPLTGFEALCDNRSLVLGHPKFQMQVVPRFSDEDVHIMTTTGSITRKNYSNTRAGEHGNLHHVYGFVMIEKSEINKNKCLIPRFVSATSEGDFIDLKHSFENGQYKRNKKCEALVMGDIHERVVDWKLISKTVEIFGQIKPKRVFLHDVFDGSTVNPHECKDLYIRKKKIKEGKYKVKEEVEDAIFFVSKMTSFFDTKEINIVESNHDVFLDRWVNNFDWKRDLHNSEDYLYFANIQQSQNLEDFGNIFGYEVCKTDFGDNVKVKYIPYGKNIRVKGVLCSMHGDFGINGSKGSVVSFGRLPTKAFIGHLHSHSVYNGSYGVGVSCKMEQYYNRKGLTTWSQGHGVVYENGKRQLIIFTKDYELTNLK